MKIQDAEEIQKLFLSKAPESYYYIPPLFKNHNGITTYAAHLFNDEEKVASLAITTLDGDNSNGEVRVELFIGRNMYHFLDNPELCKTLINEYIPCYKNEIKWAKGVSA